MAEGIIRAGMSSNGFTAGSINVDVSGVFTTEDAEDIVSNLEMVIRSVKRQAARFADASPAPTE